MKQMAQKKYPYDEDANEKLKEQVLQYNGPKTHVTVRRTF